MPNTVTSLNVSGLGLSVSSDFCDGATGLWGSRGEGPGVSAEALSYLTCSGFYSYLFSHFSAVEGESVSVNHHETP